MFVPGALPGEVVEVDVQKKKKSFARARLVKVLSASEHRVIPECPNATTCGGCQFWHTTYEHEVDIKAQAVVDTLTRISKTDIPTPTVHAAKTTTGWRNRASFHVEQGKIGFFKKNSHDVVTIQTCPVLSKELQNSLDTLRKALSRHRLSGDIFAESCSEGSVVSTSDELSEVLTIEGPIKGISTPAEDRGNTEIPAHLALAGVSVDLEVTLPPRQFRQSNSEMNVALTELVAERLDEFSGGRLLEFFAGSGNLTWTQRQKWESIVAYEGSPFAVEIANRIAASLGATHVGFVQRDLFGGDVPVAKTDVVLLDPPREGAAHLSELLAKSMPRAILYVSCDPASLARDIKTLSGAFEVARVDLLDMFPRTAHMETVALLTRRP